MKEIYSNNAGEVVVCDGCNDDGKLSKGGVLIGSSAFCGKCTSRNKWDQPDYEYANEVTKIFNKEKTFHQNVLDYRLKTYGSSDLTVQILSWD